MQGERSLEIEAGAEWVETYRDDPSLFPSERHRREPIPEWPDQSRCRWDAMSWPCDTILAFAAGEAAALKRVRREIAHDFEGGSEVRRPRRTRGTEAMTPNPSTDSPLSAEEELRLTENADRAAWFRFSDERWPFPTMVAPVTKDQSDAEWLAQAFREAVSKAHDLGTKEPPDPIAEAVRRKRHLSIEDADYNCPHPWCVRWWPMVRAAEARATLAAHPESRPDPGEGLREALAEFMSRWEQDMTHPPSGVVLRYTVVALTAERLADAILADPEVRAALASPVPTDRPEPIDALDAAWATVEASLPPGGWAVTALRDIAVGLGRELLAAYRTEPGETT